MEHIGEGTKCSKKSLRNLLEKGGLLQRVKGVLQRGGLLERGEAFSFASEVRRVRKPFFKQGIYSRAVLGEALERTEVLEKK